MARHKDVTWSLPDPIGTWEVVQVAVLYDIRDELQRLNSLLHCQNAIDIPAILRRIEKNTKKPKRRKK